MFISLAFFIEAQKRGQTSDVYHDRRRKRIRNRWALFLTLSNNPSLIEERKSEKFVHKSPLEALGVLVQDFSHLPGQVKPELRTNGVSTNASYNREAGNYEGDAMLVQTSKLWRIAAVETLHKLVSLFFLLLLLFSVVYTLRKRATWTAGAVSALGYFLKKRCLDFHIFPYFSFKSSHDLLFTNRI